MILEFELEEREGSGNETSYRILRKGLFVGSLILDKEYRPLELKKISIEAEKI